MAKRLPPSKTLAQLTQDLTLAMCQHAAAEEMRRYLRAAVDLAQQADTKRTEIRLKWALSSAHGAVRNTGYRVTQAQMAIEEQNRRRSFVVIPGGGGQ